jgi:hypothetical protein
MSLYRPYLPAITTFLGAVLLAVGFFPRLEFLRLTGDEDWLLLFPPGSDPNETTWACHDGEIFGDWC